MRPAAIEFDFGNGIATYREGLRHVAIPLEMWETWRLDPASIRWWQQGETREPVTATEREMIVDRVVLAARTEHRTSIEVAGPSSRTGAQDPGTVLGWIETALARISPPGPLTMGWRAAREFDHFGNDPDFAALINRIEDAMRDQAPADD